MCFLCTLLQTLHKGSMAAFLMQTKDNPMKALGVLAGVMGIMVLITIMISTAMFWRNKRSNKIMPVRRIIKKRQPQPSRTVRMEWLKFKRPSNAAEKFVVEDDAQSLQNENSNNNVQVAPVPPAAPVPPPPPALASSGDAAGWRVPTVSGSLTPKFINKQLKKRGHSSAHNALVSELKMRFEKRNAAIGEPHI